MHVSMIPLDKAVARALRSVLPLLALLILPLTAHADRAHPFRLPKILGFAKQPVAIASADFDHDGRADLAITNARDSTVTVFRGQADGQIGIPNRYPFHGTSIYYLDIQACDVDGDGWADLVISETAANRVHVLRNDGHGGFETDRMRSAPIGSSGLEAGVAADIDGDGRGDVAFKGVQPGEITVMFGQASGALSAPVTIANPINVRAVRLADTNHDGLADLYLIGLDSVVVRIAQPGGTFGSPVITSLLGTAGIVGVGDQDGDGRADLWAFDTQRAYVWRANGDGTFTPPAQTSTAGLGYWCAIGDIDGDGRVDAVVSDLSQPYGLVIVYRGQVGLGVPRASAWQGGGTAQLIVADTDGDGTPDLVQLSRDTYDLRLARGLGGGRFNCPIVCTSQRSSNPQDVRLADLNGDGLADLVFSNAQMNAVTVYRGAADGVPRFAQEFKAPTFAHGLAIADFDRDGHPDLFVGGGDGSESAQMLASGIGDATFTTATMTGAASFSCWWPVAADLDGDGFADLVMDNKHLSWNTGSGAGPIVILPGLPAGRTASRRAPSLGHDDLVVLGDSLRLVRFDPARALSVVSTMATSVTGNPAEATNLLARDLDRDGSDDLVALDSGVNGVQVFRGLGDHFAPGVAYPCGDADHVPSGLAIGDVDGDGFADIVVSLRDAHLNPVFASATIWYNRGNGTFTDRTDFDLGQTFGGACALGDVDGNGTLDLAIANGFGQRGSNVVLFTNTAPAVPSTVPPRGEPAAVFAITALGTQAFHGGALRFAVSAPEAGEARLDLIDVSGRRVRSARVTLEAGTHIVTLEGAALPSGLYFASGHLGSRVAHQRVVALR